MLLVGRILRKASLVEERNILANVLKLRRNCQSSSSSSSSRLQEEQKEEPRQAPTFRFKHRTVNWGIIGVVRWRTTQHTTHSVQQTAYHNAQLSLSLFSLLSLSGRRLRSQGRTRVPEGWCFNVLRIDCFFHCRHVRVRSCPYVYNRLATVG